MPNTHQHVHISFYIQVRSAVTNRSVILQPYLFRAEMKSCGQSGYHLLSASGVGAHVMVNNVFDVLHVGSLPRPVHKHAWFTNNTRQHKTQHKTFQLCCNLRWTARLQLAMAHVKECDSFHGSNGPNPRTLESRWSASIHQPISSFTCKS